MSKPDWKDKHNPDKQKPVRGRQFRKVDLSARNVKLFADTMCRKTGRRATEGHHILLRSQGGDDVPENILPLSLEPHDVYHSTGRLEGIELTEEEFGYLVSKMGCVAAADYVKRKFGMEASCE